MWKKLKVFEGLRYHYKFNNSDVVPQTLIDVFKNAIYPWDTREIITHNFETPSQPAKKKKKKRWKNIAFQTSKTPSSLPLLLKTKGSTKKGVL